ncbi:MAG: glycine--tRNA ligase subunit beta [Spirochaetes bacterium]|nr:MAG: glycine--tRNA ligase subunit beta [Spirochaetota bacterium]
MSKGFNFLCELGTEEIPAGYLPPAIEYIKTEFASKLTAGRIGHDSVVVYATPRRIAVLVEGMASAQKEEEVEVKGPSVKAAYDGAGNPTKALDGFLKGNAVSLKDLYKVSTEKGEYVYARKTMPSGKTEEIIPGILEHVVKSIPFPKRMRWSDKKLAFPRPISYLLVLFNDMVLPFSLEGIASSNKTRGHYVQFNRMVEIKTIASYEKTLRDNGVIVSQGLRREEIRGALKAAAAGLGGALVADEDLIETVTFLTENPCVVVCEFLKEFLVIPDIVLITEMKEHQKYFAVRDKKGTLLSSFLVVSNNPPTDNVRKGNERVITARFNDARFFFDEDRKTTLFSKVESLKNVLFHKELGTIFDKVERVRFIAGLIGGQMKMDAAMKTKLDRATVLCKADLNTAMVFEFTSLQGKMGRIYALLDGEDEEVANAIDEHYKPRFQGDPLPASPVAAALSIAEKIDNIIGSYSVGNIPKGSADPYALRRQANAIVELIIRNGLRLNVRDILVQSAGRYKNGGDLVPKILEFISARANTIFTEAGFRYDEIDACLSIPCYDYLDLYARARSLHEFRTNEGFAQMLLSFKRMNNIVTAFRQKNAGYRCVFDATRLQADEEKKLHGFFDSRKAAIADFIAAGKYIDLFALLIDGKGIIDAFFDAVMVMTDDTAVRDNRIALLELILAPFNDLMDFSKIAE